MKFLFKSILIILIICFSYSKDVYWIGNSYSFVHDLTGILQKMVRSRLNETLNIEKQLGIYIIFLNLKLVDIHYHNTH
jgi:hypothetical protein